MGSLHMRVDAVGWREGRAGVTTLSLLLVAACGLSLAIVGAMGPAIVAAIGLSAAAFGLATSGFFVATAVVAYPAGRWVDVSGWQQGLRTAGLLAAVGLGVGAVTQNQLMLAVAMSLTGAALGVVMPACVRAVRVVSDRGGLATPLGYLHAVIPASIMVVGAAVAVFPIIDAWRTAFGGAAVSAVLVTFLVPRPAGRGVSNPVNWIDSEPTNHPDTRESEGARPAGIGMMLVAITFAAFASGVLVTSFAVSTVSLGLEPSRAASLLSFGTLLGLVVRILSGVVSDRIGSVGAVPAGFLLAFGAAGALMVASDRGSVAFGAVVALGLGLGWPGLLYAAVAQRSRGRVGSAIGLVEVCASAGAASGPFLFGLLLDDRGAAAAWYLVTVALGVAAVSSLASGGGDALALRRSRRAAPSH